jgi:hypothetical protein
MRIRRLFWLGAAILFSIAALVAITAVVRGQFGETTGRILMTCGLAFVCGSVVLSGLACIERAVVRPAAWAAVASGLAMFVVMDTVVWGMDVSSRTGRAIGILAMWMAVALIVTTLRLVTTSPKLLRTLVPATWTVAGLAATLGTVMVIAGHPGSALVKLEIVLVILMLLGYALTPILQRFWAGAGSGPEAPTERLLGTIGGIDVFAVHGGERCVTIGSTSAKLAASEGLVLRERG